MPDLIIENNLNYTFIRTKNLKSEILELRKNVFSWTNDLDNCLGYFPGASITQKFMDVLIESSQDGYDIVIDSFDSNGQHIDTITEKGT